MGHWSNFFSLIFWSSLALFSLNLINLLVTMVVAEICWLFLYSYTIICGSINDDLNLITLSFFILALASAEFAVIYVIAVLMKNFNKNLDLYKHDVQIKKYFLNNTNKLIFNLR